MNVKHPNRLYKTDRLNYIVNRMRVNQDITPTKLAEELHVSERTVYRDLRNLEKGQALKKRYSRREGRYLLENELTLPPVTFTPSEALAVYAAAANPALADGNFFAADLRAGLTKIGQAVAPDAARDGVARKGSLSIAPFSLSRESVQRPLIEMIRRAMRSNRKLGVRYWLGAPDCERALLVSPFDVRAVDGETYLLGSCEELGGLRLFKFGRIRAAEISGERFRFPRRFSADAFFDRAWQTQGDADGEITVRVRFDPDVAAHVVDSRGQQFTSMETRPDGSLVCTAVVNTPRELSWWVLSYGSKAEVLSPPDLRTEMSRAAQDMAALYASAP